MELMMFIFLGAFMLASFYFGVKAGKGEELLDVPAQFKPIIRTEEQQEKLLDKLRSK